MGRSGIGLAVVLTLACGSGPPSSGKSAPPNAQALPIPAGTDDGALRIELEDLVNGATREIDKLRGSKLTVIAVWASWCAPCIQDLRTMQMLHERYAGGDRVAFVAVNRDSTLTRALASSLAKDAGLTMPSLYDPTDILVQRLREETGESGRRDIALPLRAFINSSTQVYWKEGSESSLRQVAGLEGLSAKQIDTEARLIERGLDGTLFQSGRPHPDAGHTHYERIDLQDGGSLRFAVTLPEDYRIGQERPMMLALPPGNQSQGAVDTALDVYWESEALRRGVVVISPIAPEGTLFFSGGESVIPELVAYVVAHYPARGGRIHLTGLSFGGISAFHVALRYPDYFCSLTVLPGFPPGGREVGLQQLSDLQVLMYVGERDRRWRRRMDGIASRLEEIGISVHYEVLARERHMIRSLEGRGIGRVFDRLGL